MSSTKSPSPINNNHTPTGSQNHRPVIKSNRK